MYLIRHVPFASYLSTAIVSKFYSEKYTGTVSHFSQVSNPSLSGCSLASFHPLASSAPTPFWTHPAFPYARLPMDPRPGPQPQDYPLGHPREVQLAVGRVRATMVGHFLGKTGILPKGGHSSGSNISFLRAAPETVTNPLGC